MREEILAKLKNFNRECAENLAGAVDEILNKEKEKKVHAIGFITTDDFYGFYLTWGGADCEIKEYYDWEQGMYPDFLYEPLVEAVDACKEIDFTTKSDEKWEFMEILLGVLKENIAQIPDEVFQKNHYRREDVTFFATMSDGDYIEEMMSMSVKMLNAKGE